MQTKSVTRLVERLSWKQQNLANEVRISRIRHSQVSLALLHDQSLRDCHDREARDRDSFGTISLVLLSLGFCLSGVLVLGQEALFMDNFDGIALTNWEITEDYGEWSFSARDGYAFLNLTGVNPAAIFKVGGGFKAWTMEEFIFVGLEMRIRFSSDNRLASESGGGIRTWGFHRLPSRPAYTLTFQTMSEGFIPAYDEFYPTGHPTREMIGFYVSCMTNDEWVFWQRVEGVDLTEWHTYTILWKPENASFLVDGDMVATTDEVPLEEMRILLRSAPGQNLTLPCCLIGQDEVCTDEYMQVDYVRVFTTTGWQDEVSQDMSTLFSLTDTGIRDKAKNTARLRDDCTMAEEMWEKEGYPSYGKVKETLERILTTLEIWDEVVDMFSQANTTIRDAEQLGADTRTINMMKGYYAQAETKWKEYEIDDTKTYLQKILDMPEPPLLCIIGLILLPTHLRRRYGKTRKCNKQEI